MEQGWQQNRKFEKAFSVNPFTSTMCVTWMENKFRIGSLEHGRHFSFIHVCGSLSVASREPSVVTLTHHDTPVCVSCTQWELEDVVAYHQVLIWLLAVTTVRSPTGFPTCFFLQFCLPLPSSLLASLLAASLARDHLTTHFVYAWTRKSASSTGASGQHRCRQSLDDTKTKKVREMCSFH